MQNMELIMTDPQLYSEFVKAYLLAALYRERLQFRKALIEFSTIHDAYIYNHAVEEVLADAISGYINPVLKEG